MRKSTMAALAGSLIGLAASAGAQSGDLLGNLRALGASARQFEQLVAPKPASVAIALPVGPAAPLASTRPAHGDGMLPVTGPTVVVGSLDIAGVRLGMSPADARTAMIRNGFRPIAGDNDQPSWEGLVAERVAARLGGTAKPTSVPILPVGFGPGQQRLEIMYAATPTGVITTSVKYTMSMDRLAPQAFRERLLAKYGPPSQVGYGQTMLWCSPASGNACPI